MKVECGIRGFIKKLYIALTGAELDKTRIIEISTETAYLET